MNLIVVSGILLLLVSFSNCQTLNNLLKDKNVAAYLFDNYDYDESGTWKEDERGFVTTGKTNLKAAFAAQASKLRGETFFAFFAKSGQDYWYSKASKYALYVRKMLKKEQPGGTYEEVKNFLNDNIIVSMTASNIIDDTDKPTKEIECRNINGDNPITDDSISLAGSTIVCTVSLKNDRNEVTTIFRTPDITFDLNNGKKIGDTEHSMGVMYPGAFVRVIRKEVRTSFNAGSGNGKGDFYVNGLKKNRNTKIRSYSSTLGKDSLVQFISEEGKILIWNAFIPHVQSLDSTETVSLEVAKDEKFTFSFPLEDKNKKLKFNMDKWFPRPIVIWEKSEKETLTVKMSPTKFVQSENDETGPYEVEKEINVENDGTYKAKLYNGVQTINTKSSLTINIDVTNSIEEMYPRAEHWYDAYQEGFVAVQKDETLFFTCKSKRHKNDKVWWYIDGDLYKSGADNITLLGATNNNFNNIKSSKLNFEAYTKAKDEDSKTNVEGYLFIDELKVTIVSEEDLKGFNVSCFVNDMEGEEKNIKDKWGSRHDPDSKIRFKTITTRVYKFVIDPIIKGPLSVIKEEGANIGMTCYHASIPPAHISFMFRDKTGGGGDVNITHQTEFGEADSMYSRYTIKRENDNKTVLTIQQIDEEDVGNYTCYAINRAVHELAHGPIAQLIMEDKCQDGAKFCFNFGQSPVQNTFLLIPVMSFVFTS